MIDITTRAQDLGVKEDMLQQYRNAKSSGTQDAWLKAHPIFAGKLSSYKASKEAVSTQPSGDPVITSGTEPLTVGKTGDVFKQDTGTLIENEASLAAKEAAGQIGVGNANVDTPFGTATITMVDGKPTVTLKESTNQSNIRQGGEGLTQAGQTKAASNLANISEFSGDTFDRSKIEQTYYDKATKTLDRDLERELATKEQELYNKGIPYSDDPKSRYQKEIRGIQDRYDALKESAMQNAVLTGGTEATTAFNIAQGTQNQRIKDIQALEGLGTGYVGAPSGTAATGATFDIPGILETATAQLEAKLQRKLTNAELNQIKAQIEALGASSGGGGSSEESSLPSGLD